MSKKTKRSEAPGEEIVIEDAAAETPEEKAEEATVEAVVEETPAEAAAEENIAVSEEPANINGGEEVSAQAPAAAPADPDAKEGTVSRPVNFRTGPSFNNAVIAALKPGSKLALDGTVEGDKGTWYKCVFDGRTGYVKASGVIV